MNNYEILKMLTTDKLLDVLSNTFSRIDRGFVPRSDELRNTMIACEILEKERGVTSARTSLDEISKTHRDVRAKELNRTIKV